MGKLINIEIKPQTLSLQNSGEIYKKALSEFEEPLFKAILEFTGGNQSYAAIILGMNRGTFRTKLKGHGLI